MDIQVDHKGEEEENYLNKTVTSGDIQQTSQNCVGWNVIMARIYFPTECQGARVPSGEISDVPFSRWDKNGVCSPAEQITELSQLARGVYQPRRRSPKLHITARLSLRLSLVWMESS